MAGSWKKIRGALSQENVRSVIFDPGNTMPLMVALYVMEIFINVWVIQNIRCKLDVASYQTGRNIVVCDRKIKELNTFWVVCK